MANNDLRKIVILLKYMLVSFLSVRARSFKIIQGQDIK